MKTQNGLTLVELIVAMAVAGIVLSVGVPTFQGVVRGNDMAASSNQFVASVNLARSSAVKFQRDAIICASSNYNATTPTCDTGTTDWSNGWIVWVDKDRDDAVDTDEVLSVFEPLDDDATFSAASQARFTYNARGFVESGDELNLCDDRTGEVGRRIRINGGGRVNVSQQTCS